MAKNSKAFKKLVRTRIEQTGESYMEAMRQLQLEYKHKQKKKEREEYRLEIEKKCKQ